MPIPPPDRESFAFPLARLRDRSAATALAGSHSLEAAIHYSGLLYVRFPPRATTGGTFQLDQPGNCIRLFHRSSYSFALFGIYDAFTQGFREYTAGATYFVSKLSFGQRISAGHFSGGYDGVMAEGARGAWTDPGVGFIGFKFNSGAGIQYGWARIKMAGSEKKNGFELLDYAYGDPGEPVSAGQKSNVEQGPDQGSLGGLALGAVGLLAWRKSRSRTAS
jgi:hypothetical protein